MVYAFDVFQQYIIMIFVVRVVNVNILYSLIEIVEVPLQCYVLYFGGRLVYLTCSHVIRKYNYVTTTTVRLCVVNNIIMCP